MGSLGLAWMNVPPATASPRRPRSTARPRAAAETRMEKGRIPPRRRTPCRARRLPETSPTAPRHHIAFPPVCKNFSCLLRSRRRGVATASDDIPSSHCPERGSPCIGSPRPVQDQSPPNSNTPQGARHQDRPRRPRPRQPPRRRAPARRRHGGDLHAAVAGDRRWSSSPMEEDVDVIGVSSLATDHLIVPKLMNALRAGLGDVAVVVGGIVPDEDERKLRKPACCTYSAPAPRARGDRVQGRRARRLGAGRKRQGSAGVTPTANDTTLFRREWRFRVGAGRDLRHLPVRHRLRFPAPSRSGLCAAALVARWSAIARRTAASTAKTSCREVAPSHVPETPSAGEKVVHALTQQSFELDRRCPRASRAANSFATSVRPAPKEESASSQRRTLSPSRLLPTRRDGHFPSLQ